MRIAVIGAAGKVARQLLQHLLFDDDGNRDLVLISRSTDRVRGAVLDISSALPLVGGRTTGIGCNSIEITANLAAARGSELVIIAAGAWPAAEVADQFQRHDASGRLVQSHVNFQLVRQVCKDLAKCCPDAHVLVVTNQSDLMSTLARTMLAPGRVLGMGGMLDSARLRALLAGERPETGAEGPRRAHMIGYHNDQMFPLASSLPPNLSPEQVQRLTQQTRAQGRLVTDLQRDSRFPTLNSGSSVLPGFALYAAIKAYTGRGPAIEECFNVLLDESPARTYGTEPGHGLSVPVQLARGTFRVAETYAVSPTEQQALAQAQQQLAKDWALLATLHAAHR